MQQLTLQLNADVVAWFKARAAVEDTTAALTKACASTSFVTGVLVKQRTTCTRARAASWSDPDIQDPDLAGRDARAVGWVTALGRSRARYCGAR